MSKTKIGSKFYSEQGLKPITVHVNEKVHAALRAMAGKSLKSLQVLVAEILEQAVKKTH